MSEENVEKVREVYASWAQGDFSASLPLFDENVVLVIDTNIPDGGTYVGRDGIREYMEVFLASWESLSIAGESFKEMGDTVFVAVRQSGIGQGSGAPVETSYFQLWTFRSGRVVRIEAILNEQEALEAAGLQE